MIHYKRSLNTTLAIYRLHTTYKWIHLLQRSLFFSFRPFSTKNHPQTRKKWKQRFSSVCQTFSHPFTNSHLMRTYSLSRACLKAFSSHANVMERKETRMNIQKYSDDVKESWNIIFSSFSPKNKGRLWVEEKNEWNEFEFGSAKFFLLCFTCVTKKGIFCFSFPFEHNQRISEPRFLQVRS